MKKYMMFLLLLCVISLSTPGFATDMTQTTTPMDTTSTPDTVTDPVVDSFNVNNALGDVRNLKATVDTLTQELFDLDTQERTGTSGAISDKYRSVRTEIVKVITTIQQTTDQIDVMMRRVGIYKQNIANSIDAVKKLRQDIDDTKKSLQETALFLYQTNNYVADPANGMIDEVKLFLHSDNIARTLANQQVVENMLTHYNDLLTKLTTIEEMHVKAIIKMNELRNTAKQDIITYGSALEQMQQKKMYLMQFIELYRNGSLHGSMVGGVFQDKKSVHEAVTTMLDGIQNKNYSVSFNIFDKLKELETMQIQYPYDIAWPIYPITHIDTFFDDQAFREKNGFPNRSIQISATQGTPIYATRDAVVYHVTDNDAIGINRIVLLHTDGYVSVYTYINKTVVHEGDIVKRGQLLGYSGGEPGTRGAGFISSGPNLTFSVFKDGTAVDPLRLLDISVVQDKSMLPDLYLIKYLRDKYARTIDITDLPLLSGNTVNDRAQQFLSLYGVGVFRSVTFWDNAVKETNIDRDTVMCIAFAESTLGQYLSTNNNIGNVGNNDRGDRFSFGSAMGGARAIAETLNNQHLGDYHTIDQLSRYGNNDGKIYASSPINREKNVLKCLSQIKGYYIPEDFPFRTGVNSNKVATETGTASFDWQQVRVGQ